MLEIHCPRDFRFTHKASAAWSDSFVVSADGEEAVIVFDRNKAGDIFTPRLERGSTDLLMKIVAILSDIFNTHKTLESPMRQAYDFLCSLSNGEIKVTTIKVAPYKDEILIEHVSSSCFAAVHYGADRMASKVEFQSGDIKTFQKFSAFARNQQ